MADLSPSGLETRCFLFRTIHDAGTDPVHVDTGYALAEVAATFHGGGMISVLPECAFSVFAQVVFLAGSFMAPMSNMPDMAGNIMSLCTSHLATNSLTNVFEGKNDELSLLYAHFQTTNHIMSIG